MKVKIICGALLACADAQRDLMPDISPRPPRPQDGERRYKQLTEMMAFINPDFNELKYWTYGCQCLILGDRPMSDPGYGRPVDQLDQVCKEYKDCLKCARMAHGDTCIGEIHKYRFGMRKGAIKCRDNPGNSPTEKCRRHLCECDAQFARAHVNVKDHFKEQYHMFWSESGWEPKDQCSRNPGGTHDPQCCGSATSPLILYNANTKQCCSDGTVKTQC